MRKVRVLIVDDSPTMQSLIARVLARDPEIEVVGRAGDPLQAREEIKRLAPDVVTLDIEMPRMNGIEFLERLMRLRPTPVIMVSTLTQPGAEASLAALELGAFDCVAKPGFEAGSAGFDELVEKVKAAARSRVRPREDRPAPGPAMAGFRPNGRLVAIGSSTGGVEALIAILQAYPEACPPTVITQHMPAAFTTSFAARLDRLSAARVEEAYDGAPLAPGQVYLAPGGARHLEVVGSGAGMRCRLVDSPPVNGHRPSVDVLFKSVATAVGEAAVGVILTGMGRDGADGMLGLRKAGARTLGQDEATCVVYGMPKAAAELGAVETQLPLHRMAVAILTHAGASQREHA